MSEAKYCPIHNWYWWDCDDPVVGARGCWFCGVRESLEEASEKAIKQLDETARLLLVKY